jgi:hypothetical protein
MGDLKVVSIIRCGPFFFFTTAVPDGSTRELRLDSLSSVSTTIITYDNMNYFVLFAQSDLSPSDEEAIREAVQYTWSELHRRGIVADPAMPEWILGDPTLMNPTKLDDGTIM